MTIEEIIDALIESDIDGETTQYILEQIGMDVQMAIQLTNKYPSVVQERLNELKSEGVNEKEAEKETPIMKQAQQMLLDW